MRKMLPSEPRGRQNGRWHVTLFPESAQRLCSELAFRLLALCLCCTNCTSLSLNITNDRPGGKKQQFSMARLESSPSATPIGYALSSYTTCTNAEWKYSNKLFKTTSRVR